MSRRRCCARAIEARKDGIDQGQVGRLCLGAGDEGLSDLREHATSFVPGPRSAF